MIKRLAIVGASGHGKVIADIAHSLGIEQIIFYDDRYPQVSDHYGLPVGGNVKAAISSASQYDAAIVAIGNASTRADIQSRLPKIASALIHPTAYVSRSATLGAGTVVMPQAVINADAKIGEGVIVNSGAIIEHDCVIGNYVHICPNTALGGGATVGEHSWIGLGSSVIQLINIGEHVTIGAGSVVVKDTANHQTLIGNPAKPIKR